MAESRDQSNMAAVINEILARALRLRRTHGYTHAHSHTNSHKQTSDMDIFPAYPIEADQMADRRTFSVYVSKSKAKLIEITDLFPSYESDDFPGHFLT